MANYVKFMRGSFTAYTQLKEANQLNDDTLYFIYEEDSLGGELYLGPKLIAGSESLSSLSDIEINPESLADKQVLAYDAGSDKWVNTTVKEAVTDVFTGATSQSSGVAGLVPAPELGQTDLFLRSDGIWAPVSADTDLSDYLTAEEVERAIASAIADIPAVSATDDGVVNIKVENNQIIASHSKQGPANGVTAGATADQSINTFGSSIEFKVPHISVDEYGHTIALTEKTIAITLPDAPANTDTQYEMKYEVVNGTKVINLYNKNEGTVVSSIDATPFIKDGMLSDVDYDPSKNTLTFVWNTEAGLQADTVVLSDILDPYIAGNGIAISTAENNTNHAISIKLAENESNLLLNSDGLSTNFNLANYASAADMEEAQGAIANLNANKVDKEYQEVPVIDDASGSVIDETTFNAGAYYILEDGKYVIATEYVEGTTYYTQAYNEDGSWKYEYVPYTLLSPEDKEKLDLLVFDEDGGVSVSGNIHISQVQGLEGYLGEKHFSTAVVDKLNYITNVDPTHFTVTDNQLLFTPTAGRLLTVEDEAQLHLIEAVDNTTFEIKPIVVGQDTNGKNIIKNTLHLISVSAAALQPTLGDLSKLPTIEVGDTTSNTIVDNINNIYSILTWGEMTV